MSNFPFLLKAKSSFQPLSTSPKDKRRKSKAVATQNVSSAIRPVKTRVTRAKQTPKKLVQQLIQLVKIIFLVLLIAGLGLYAVSLTLDNGTAVTTYEARSIDEQNQSLEADLGHLQSFQSVEAAAKQLTGLHAPTQPAIEVSAGEAGFVAPLPKHVQTTKRYYLPVLQY
jgi:hypothetical protein